MVLIEHFGHCLRGSAVVDVGLSDVDAKAILEASFESTVDVRAVVGAAVDAGAVAAVDVAGSDLVEVGMGMEVVVARMLLAEVDIRTVARTRGLKVVSFVICNRIDSQLTLRRVIVVIHRIGGPGIARVMVCRYRMGSSWLSLRNGNGLARDLARLARRHTNTPYA